MFSRTAALLASLVLGCSACAQLPQAIPGQPFAAATAYDLDRWAGERPSEAELAQSISTPVDPLEFYALLTLAEPRSGSVLWVGGFLVVVRDVSTEPDLYRISYYGGFFRRVGVPGWYEIPEQHRARWNSLLGQPGALGRIAQQRVQRNAGTAQPGSP